VRNRLAVLDRDDHRCVRCGRTNRLHVHHKHSWKPGQGDPHALDNLETLCASCHRKAHPVPQAPNGKFVSTRQTPPG
jgi:5-methylcytosine-specific restriction endonuclease McrA